MRMSYEDEGYDLGEESDESDDVGMDPEDDYDSESEVLDDE